MTTAAPQQQQQHPNILGAISALADLADQYQWLADLLEPGTPDRRPRHITPAARATMARQQQAEKADLVETKRQGLAPRGPSAAPLVVGVLHAQMQAHDTAMDAAWRVTSALHGDPTAPRYRAAGATDTARFAEAVDYLGDGLLLVTPDLAGVLGGDLNLAARTAGQVTRSEPARQDFGYGPCPACGVDSLVVQTTSIFEDALVMCSRGGCRCHGVDCRCRRPARTPGLRHIWPSGEFAQLSAVLRRVAA